MKVNWFSMRYSDLLKILILVGLGLTNIVPNQTMASVSCAELNLLEVSDQLMGQKNTEIIDSFELLYQLDQFEAADATSVVLGQTHRLKEYVIRDSKNNLALKSPFDVMNAAQRMLAIIYSEGKKTVKLPLSGEEVNFYPFFSSGTPATNGFRIVGNEKVVNELVANIQAQARGDRSGVSIVLLVGGAGTGKSETLKLLSIGAENLTSDPHNLKYATHTFKWTHLGEIPSLRKFIPTTENNGVKVYEDLDAPLGDSPFTLLPTEIQKILVTNTKEAVESLTDGLAPAPITQPDPISQFIRNEIIQFYSLQKGHSLNAAEIVDVLDKHIIVKRQVMGQSAQNMPIISAQGNNIDIQGLFMSPNPVVKFGAGVGPTHPMAWYLNGKILKGHGNAILLDEYFRNPKDFRDMLLQAMESRILTIGGAPSVAFDSVMVAATNTANLEEILAEGQGKGGDSVQGTGYAAVDRFTLTPMRYPLSPDDIARVLLYGKMSEFYQQPIGQNGERTTMVKGKIDDLLPRRESLTKIQTSDYRYKIWFGDGADKIEVAPHALMLMAEILSATRLKTNPEEASKVTSSKVVISQYFRNPIDRIRLYEGSVSNVRPDELRELHEVSLLLKEGESGIGSRDGNRWLKDAIIAARESDGATLTPGIVISSFKKGLIEGRLRAPSNGLRLAWLSLANEVVNQLLIPRLDADISRGLANGDRVVKDAYFDMLDEMFALETDENSQHYVSSFNGQQRPIDFERLKQVKDLYKRKNGRSLNVGQISIFHARQAQVQGSLGKVPDESLLESVAGYYASLNTQLAGFDAIVDFERTGEGSDEVRSAHQSLIESLHQMGYNSVAIRDALMLIKNARSQNEKTERP